MATQIGPSVTPAPIATDIIRGDAHPLATRTRTWVVPGIDGTGVQTTGDGAGEFRLELIHYGTAAEINVWLKLIMALQGLQIEFTNNRPLTFTNLFCQRVSVVERKLALHEGGETIRVAVQGVRLEDDTSIDP